MWHSINHSTKRDLSNDSQCRTCGIEMCVCVYLNLFATTREGCDLVAWMLAVSFFFSLLLGSLEKWVGVHEVQPMLACCCCVIICRAIMHALSIVQILRTDFGCLIQKNTKASTCWKGLSQIEKFQCIGVGHAFGSRGPEDTYYHVQKSKIALKAFFVIFTAHHHFEVNRNPYIFYF